MNRPQIPTFPRLLVLFADFIVLFISFCLSYAIEKRFVIEPSGLDDFFVYSFTYSFSSIAIFFCMNIHCGVIRYSTISDMIRIFCAVALSSVLYAISAKLIVVRFFDIDSLNAFSVLLINFFVASCSLLMVRIFVRVTFAYIKNRASGKKEKVLIYGSGPESILIKQALETTAEDQFFISGFLADRNRSHGLKIQQKKVFSGRHLERLVNKGKVEKLVLTNNDLSEVPKSQVISKCFELGIKILTVPPSAQWVYGKLKLGQIQDLKIEHLLQRDPIQISDVSIFSQLSGKRILITGAAGSIGSEIVRQVIRYKPAMVIICDVAESPLHDILLEIQDRSLDIEIKWCLVNVREFDMIRAPFENYRPEIVFHAAAYKHVPMMESHPVEAILTNVLGTKHVANLSVMYEVDRFVMISTDKAVNPTNIMGASKRIAEIYIQSLKDSAVNCKTKFMTTRFGNVLDSSGSVIPRFRSQIQNGGPVTVTHPEIVRYFMTIPEAVQLVLEAAATGDGGEIFVFDMGKPVKIYDLATNMIKLAGLTVDKDIKIVFTGLRPGEKLYEELLNDEELVKPTHHEKIKIAKVIKQDHEKVQRDVYDLIRYAKFRDEENIVRKMKSVVPEFKSQNSIYTELDFNSMQVRVS